MCPMGRSKGKSRLRTILSIIEKVFDKSCDCFQEGAGVSSAACLLLKPLHLAPPLQYSRRPLLFVCLASAHLRLSSNLFGILSVRGASSEASTLSLLGYAVGLLLLVP